MPAPTETAKAAGHAQPAATAMLRTLQANSTFMAQPISQEAYRAEEPGSAGGESAPVAALLCLHGQDARGALLRVLPQSAKA